jgi:hypothetical protein
MVSAEDRRDGELHDGGSAAQTEGIRIILGISGG